MYRKKSSFSTRRSLFMEEGSGAATCSAGSRGGIELGGGGGADVTGGVHLLPCCVKMDGPAPVAQYFKPRPAGHVIDGVTVEEAFFRGRKLEGTTIPIPEGYRGYVLEKKSLEGVEGGSNLWVAQAEFRSLTYWNHDSVPSKDDPIPRCFHWFSVANALHKPVTAEELATTLAAQDKGAERK